MNSLRIRIHNQLIGKSNKNLRLANDGKSVKQEMLTAVATSEAVTQAVLQEPAFTCAWQLQALRCPRASQMCWKMHAPMFFMLQSF